MMRTVYINKNIYIEEINDEIEYNIQFDEDDIIYWFDMQMSNDAIDFLERMLESYGESADTNEPVEYLDDTLKRELWESVKDKFTLQQLEERLK